MAGALEPMVEATMAPSVPRLPAARMESCAFNTVHLTSDRLPWLAFGVFTGNIRRTRGMIEEIAPQLAGLKSILILDVTLSSAAILAATGFQPRSASTVTVDESNCQPAPRYSDQECFGSVLAEDDEWRRVRNSDAHGHLRQDYGQREVYKWRLFQSRVRRNGVHLKVAAAHNQTAAASVNREA